MLDSREKTLFLVLQLESASYFSVNIIFLVVRRQTVSRKFHKLCHEGDFVGINFPFRDDALCASSTCIMFIIVRIRVKWHDVKINHSSRVIQLPSEKLLFHFSTEKASEEILPKKAFLPSRKENLRDQIYSAVSVSSFRSRREILECDSHHAATQWWCRKCHTQTCHTKTFRDFKWNSTAEIKTRNDIFPQPNNTNFISWLETWSCVHIFSQKRYGTKDENSNRNSIHSLFIQ